jgi:ABC-type Fe3+-hydroxamate transport system substrate-binding protein
LNSLIIFHTTKNLINLLKGEHMKKLFTLTSIAGAIAALAFISGCQTTGSSQSVVAQKEALLAQSGFKVITVTTPQQQQAVSGLTQGRVSAVKYNGKLYYVFPTGTKDKVYVGKQPQYNKYKSSLAAAAKQQPSQAASHPSMAQMGEAQMAGQSLEPTLETAGPEHIEVQQFGGFGPMGVNAMGDW